MSDETRQACPTLEDIETALKNGADLSRGVFCALDLRQAEFCRGKFRKADFTGANLLYADFSGADLTEAILVNADLSETNLSEADLSGADLTGACLSDAIIGTARFVGAIGIIDAGTDDRGYRFIGVQQVNGWMIKAGCRWFTFEEAIEHWQDDDNEDALERVSAIIAASNRPER